MSTGHDAHVNHSEEDGNGDLRRKHFALLGVAIWKEIRAKQKPGTTAAKSRVKTSQMLGTMCRVGILAFLLAGKWKGCCGKQYAGPSQS